MKKSRKNGHIQQQRKCRFTTINHASMMVMVKIKELKSELLFYLSYSKDLILRDFYLLQMTW